MPFGDLFRGAVASAMRIGVYYFIHGKKSLYTSLYLITEAIYIRVAEPLGLPKAAYGLPGATAMTSA